MKILYLIFLYIGQSNGIYLSQYAMVIIRLWLLQGSICHEWSWQRLANRPRGGRRVIKHRNGKSTPFRVLFPIETSIFWGGLSTAMFDYQRVFVSIELQGGAPKS